MKKAIFKVPNYTGRIFLCIDNNSELLDNPTDCFDTGKEYYEALMDSDNHNHVKKDDEHVLLIGKNGVALYVEEENFILLSTEVNKIALQKFWLN